MKLIIVDQVGVESKSVKWEKEQHQINCKSTAITARVHQALTTLHAKVTASTHAEGATAAEVGHEIAQSNLDTFLTPSSIAAELRPDLIPAAAADIYTGARPHDAPSPLCSVSRGRRH